MEIEPEPTPERAKDLKLLPKNSAGRHDQIFKWLDTWCSACDTDSEKLAMLNDKLDDLQVTGTGMSYNTRKSFFDSMVLKFSLQNTISMKKKTKKQKPILSGNMGAEYGTYDLKLDPATNKKIESLNEEWAKLN